jgi:streptomycin 6-kinase
MSRLEAAARGAATRFGVRLGKAYAMSNYSFVAPAGRAAAVKVRWEEDDESDEEADALRLWNGNGAVRLLAEDRAERALLLERAVPGTDISGLDEDAALEAAIDVARRLWVHAGTPFRWIGDHVPRWLDNAERWGGPDHELVPLARELHESLAVGRASLVHGDFHHHNILSSRRGYLAIDPKPMLGEPEFDVPSFLWNPLGSEFRLDVAEHRIAAFAAAGLDEDRIRKWAVIRGAYLGHGGGDADVLRALVRV